MKTFKLKTLFSVLLCTGLLFSCSNDDSFQADDPVTPGPRTGTPSDATSIDLAFSAKLDNFSEEAGCGDDLYLFQHSGEGADEITGAFTAEVSYCGQPDSHHIFDLQITLENANGDKIFLRQGSNSGIEEGPGNDITNNNNEFGTGEVENPGDFDNNSAILDNGLITLEVVGGTGAFTELHGALSSKVTPAFLAGSDELNFTFAGIVGGL